MRKYALLVTALGGALGGYILSNEKLRREIAHAPDAEEMAKLLGHHLASDGKKVAKEVKAFVEHQNVRGNLKKAGTYATARLHGAKRKLTAYGKKAAMKK